MTRPPQSTRRAAAVVSGRVQGVGFRDATAREARGAGLGGWVRNRDDGAVEVELEGPSDAVERVLAWLSRGPRGARVADVAVNDRTPTGAPPAFDVR